MINVNDILTHLTAAEFSTLWEATECEAANVYELTVGDFIELTADDDGLLRWCGKHPAESVAEWFVYAKSISKALEGFAKTLEELRVSQTNEEQMAAHGVKFPTFAMGMLTDCVEWYHLTSTKAAETLPLSDWYIFAKKRAAAAVYQRNLERVIKQKRDGQR